MRRRTAIQMLGTLALMAPTAASKLWAQGEKKGEKKDEKKQAPAAPPPLALKVGDEAPDFTLPDQTYRNKVSLHDFKGKKNVALAFYIFAFTGG